VKASTDRPDLSVVVVTRDSSRTLLPCVGALAEQTNASAIELIIVAPDTEAGALPAAEAAPFHSCKVVAVGPIVNRGQAAAAGVEAASAAVVALSENHCFPVADWAARTLEAHAAGHVAVGPSVTNANASSPLSRVLHAAGYGQFPSDAQPGERDELPLHNTSYRTDTLLAFGDDLAYLLADERRLQSALRERGHVLYFHPAARKRHINEATFSLLTGLAFDCGRRYGGVRARSWSRWRRVAYGVLSPALTIPIAANMRRNLRMAGATGGLDETMVSWLWAFIHAISEGVAYLTGEIHDFPFTEAEEFLIRERLGRSVVTDPEVAALLKRLD
jgi:hypothetical protein